MEDYSNLFSILREGDTTKLEKNATYIKLLSDFENSKYFSIHDFQTKDKIEAKLEALIKMDILNKKNAEIKAAMRKTRRRRRKAVVIYKASQKKRNVLGKNKFFLANRRRDKLKRGNKLDSRRLPRLNLRRTTKKLSIKFKFDYNKRALKVKNILDKSFEGELKRKQEQTSSPKKTEEIKVFKTETTVLKTEESEQENKKLRRSINKVISGGKQGERPSLRHLNVKNSYRLVKFAKDRDDLKVNKSRRKQFEGYDYTPLFINREPTKNKLESSNTLSHTRTTFGSKDSARVPFGFDNKEEERFHQINQLQKAIDGLEDKNEEKMLGNVKKMGFFNRNDPKTGRMLVKNVKTVSYLDRPVEAKFNDFPYTEDVILREKPRLRGVAKSCRNLEGFTNGAKKMYFKEKKEADEIIKESKMRIKKGDRYDFDMKILDLTLKRKEELGYFIVQKQKGFFKLHEKVLKDDQDLKLLLDS